MTSPTRTPRNLRDLSLQRTFWTEEHGLTALLLILVVYYLLLPLVSELSFGRLLSASGLTLLAFSGAVAVSQKPALGAAVRLVAVGSLMTTWIEYVAPSRWAVLASATLDSILVALLIFVVAVQVFREGPITAHRVRGAIVIYLLIGILFAFMYLAVVMAKPGAIRFSDMLDEGNPQAIRAELGYFSFVTLTTLGYGDILPVSALARCLATVEAISGQLFVAITLARLVSAQLSNRPASSEPPSDSD